MDILFISAIGIKLGTGHFIRTCRFIKYLSKNKLIYKSTHIVLNPDNLKLVDAENNLNISLQSFIDENELYIYLENLKIKLKKVFIDIGIDSINFERIIFNNNSKFKLIIIDDLLKYKHLDSSKIICQDIFHEINKDNIYTGLNYCLISPIQIKRIRKNIKRISIFLGGTDALDISKTLFDKLEAYAINNSIFINFIITNNYKQVSFYESKSKSIDVYCDLDKLDFIIQQSDFMITTPGMTALESISNWCPVGLIKTNKDQDEIINFLISKKCCLSIDDSLGSNTIDNFLKFKIPDKEKITKLSKECSSLSISEGFKKISNLIF